MSGLRTSAVVDALSLTGFNVGTATIAAQHESDVHGLGKGTVKTYTVAVRALCEFAAKRGDLDLRFTPSPTSKQGVAGHRTVAATRSGVYRSEVRPSGA